MQPIAVFQLYESEAKFYHTGACAALHAESSTHNIYVSLFFFLLSPILTFLREGDIIEL
jgi:hypothetical protein